MFFALYLLVTFLLFAFGYLYLLSRQMIRKSVLMKRDFTYTFEIDIWFVTYIFVTFVSHKQRTLTVNIITIKNERQ